MIIGNGHEAICCIMDYSGAYIISVSRQYFYTSVHLCAMYTCPTYESVNILVIMHHIVLEQGPKTQLLHNQQWAFCCCFGRWSLSHSKRRRESYIYTSPGDSSIDKKISMCQSFKSFKIFTVLITVLMHAGPEEEGPVLISSYQDQCSSVMTSLFQ